MHFQELELCHYRGYVRDVPGSWAALSTCYGLKGVIYDGNSTFYLNRGPEEGFTYVYEGKHLKPNRNQSCGFPQSESLMRVSSFIFFLFFFFDGIITSRLEKSGCETRTVAYLLIRSHFCSVDPRLCGKHLYHSCSKRSVEMAVSTVSLVIFLELDESIIPGSRYKVEPLNQ